MHSFWLFIEDKAGPITLIAFGADVVLALVTIPSPYREIVIGLCVLITVTGVLGLFTGRKRKMTDKDEGQRPKSYGIRIENSRGGKVSRNKITGFDVGIGIGGSDDIDVDKNEIKDVPRKPESDG